MKQKIIIMLDERELRIITNWLRGWDDGGAALEGSLSYTDVFNLCDKLGIPTDALDITAFINGAIHDPR